jgi:hypothetical protein
MDFEGEKKRINKKRLLKIGRVAADKIDIRPETPEDRPKLKY